jgi:hypothetical protein
LVAIRAEQDAKAHQWGLVHSPPDHVARTLASTADRPSDQRFGVQRNQLKGTLGFGLLVDPAITHAPTVLAILIDLDLDWLARK